MAQALAVQQDRTPPNVLRMQEEKASLGATKLKEAMQAIAGELQSEATRRVGLRQSIEDRWIEDLEQYHARYDAETEKILISEERSRLFINMTRPKTNAMGARFKDMLFPTDEKCWGIEPTPVPRLAEAAEKAANQARQLEEQAKAAANDNQAPEGQAAAMAGQAKAAKDAWGELNAQLTEAKRRSDLMAEVIDDQLTECNYQAIKRDQIDWAMKIGSGITKGPVTGDRMRRGWKQKQQPVVGPDGKPVIDPATGKPKTVAGPHYLDMAEGDQPGYRLVDPWGFFPDLDVANHRDGNGDFERHLMNPKKLRELQKLKGFDVDVLRELLEAKPIAGAPAYIAHLRNIRGEAQPISGSLYQVWEYNGPLEPEQMRMLALATNNQAAFDMVADIDQLQQVNACVWFCDGKVLKFALYPYDSGESMYSIFNLVKDESCCFGYGMPAILRDLQSAFNAAWRTMMDNAGLSSGPQIVVDTSTIEPADGDFKIRARKIWKATKGITKENPPFQIFQIQSNQGDLSNILLLAERLIDTVSTMPQVAAGEPGTAPKDTPYGTTVLQMNSANVVFRDGIKNWDDDVTVPDIRRLYDWNMQFSDKEDIKGDYDIKAMGSSVLLVRELQANTLMAIALQFGGHPVFGPMLKNYELLGKLFQAMMIPIGEIMLTKEQYEAVMAQVAAQEAEDAKKAGNADKSVEIETLRLQAVREKLDGDIQLANMEADYKLKVAGYQRDTAMLTLAGQGNIKLEEIRAMLDAKQMDIAHKERALAVEAAITQAQPAQKPTGGGTL